MAVATALPTIMGCGGSASEASAGAPLTKAQLIAKADPICARFFVALHAHGTKSGSQLTGDAQLIAGYEQDELDRLRHLVAPTTIGGDWRMILGDLQAMTEDSRVISRDISEHGRSATRRLLATGVRVQRQLVTTARRDGFKDCARIS